MAVFIHFYVIKIKLYEPRNIFVPILQNGQTHPNNSSAICRRIV